MMHPAGPLHPIGYVRPLRTRSTITPVTDHPRSGNGVTPSVGWVHTARVTPPRDGHILVLYSTAAVPLWGRITPTRAGTEYPLPLVRAGRRPIVCLCRVVEDTHHNQEGIQNTLTTVNKPTDQHHLRACSEFPISCAFSLIIYIYISLLKKKQNG